MVLFYKAITYILKSSYRAKEGLSVGLIHRPALLASQIYRLCTRRRSERFGDNSIISAMQLVNVGDCAWQLWTSTSEFLWSWWNETRFLRLIKLSNWRFSLKNFPKYNLYVYNVIISVKIFQISSRFKKYVNWSIFKTGGGKIILDRLCLGHASPVRKIQQKKKWNKINFFFLSK